MNVRYARACLLDSLSRGEAPFAAHLLYPQVLSDSPEDVRKGMRAGVAVLKRCAALVVYCDNGIETIRPLMAVAESNGIEVEKRVLGESRVDLDPGPAPKAPEPSSNVVDVAVATPADHVVYDPGPVFASELDEQEAIPTDKFNAVPEPIDEDDDPTPDGPIIGSA